MTDSFISLKEAQTYTGKSRSTLRRFITTITGPDSHPDRKLIKPTVEEVKDLHAANRPFSWTVNVSLLDRAFKVTGQKAKQSAGESSSNENGTNNSANDELLRQAIDMLKTELDEKNKQIERFQERQRENNVLIKSAHEQLTKLASGSTGDSKQSTTAETVEANGAKEGSQSKQPVTDPSVKPEKKTLWQRMNQPLFTRQ